MFKPTLKIIVLIVLVFASSVITLVSLLFFWNYYIESQDLFTEEASIAWTLEHATYDPNYIFWQKEELKYKVFSTNEVSQGCKKILFLGDSFSLAIFSDKGYFQHFTENLASKETEDYPCLELITLATGGVGTSQELARFSDVVDSVRPDIVYWQFYWNDYFDNVTLSVHDLKSGELLRKKAYANPIFLVGFLSQKIPAFGNSTLGKHLLFRAEREDLFKNWPVNPENLESVIEYNRKFIPAALDDMKKLSSKYNFELYTTLSPLECQYIENQDCVWINDFQNSLRKMLIDQSKFISMERPNTNENSLVLGEKSDYSLFFSKEETYNEKYRHLSSEGEEYFGNILFYNFINQ